MHARAHTRIRAYVRVTHVASACEHAADNTSHEREHAYARTTHTLRATPPRAENQLPSVPQACCVVLGLNQLVMMGYCFFLPLYTLQKFCGAETPDQLHIFMICTIGALFAYFSLSLIAAAVCYMWGYTHVRNTRIKHRRDCRRHLVYHR